MLLINKTAKILNGEFMDKQEFKVGGNKYSVLDAFRFFFILIMVWFGVIIVFNIVVSIVASAKGVSSQELSQSDVVEVISYVISSLSFIITFLVYNKVRKVDYKYAFSDGQKISLLPISVSIVLAIIAIFLFTPFMELIEYFFMQFGYNPSDEIAMQGAMQSSGGYFMLGLLVYALLPAIAEEIVFRGVIQNALLTKYNGFVSIFISTLLFVLMHGSLQQTAYQLVMGIMLGYVACVGGSILYSIILHFLNNAFVLLFGCFDIVPYLSEETYYYNVYSMIFPICIFLLGVILVGILFWVLKYLRTKNFFRYEPKKKKKKKVQVVVEEKKIGFKDFWKGLAYHEKIYAIAGIVLIGLIWLINTISQFLVA